MEAAIAISLFIIVLFFFGGLPILFSSRGETRETKWHYRKVCTKCGYHEYNELGNCFFGFNPCPECGVSGKDQYGSYSGKAVIQTMRYVNKTKDGVVEEAYWETKGE